MRSLMNFLLYLISVQLIIIIQTHTHFPHEIYNTHRDIKLQQISIQVMFRENRTIWFMRRLMTNITSISCFYWNT